MRLEQDWSPILERIDRSARAATADTMADIQSRLPRRSGRLVAGMRVVESSRDADHIALAITSDAPYAGAVERGADVGPRRGPHMAGGRVIRDTAPGFGAHMTEHLRSRS